MTYCEHDPTDICKSCNQTIREEGSGKVVLHEKPEPEVTEKPPAKITPFRSKKGK